MAVPLCCWNKLKSGTQELRVGSGNQDYYEIRKIREKDSCHSLAGKPDYHHALFACFALFVVERLLLG